MCSNTKRIFRIYELSTSEPQVRGGRTYIHVDTVRANSGKEACYLFDEDRASRGELRAKEYNHSLVSNPNA
jgi:hypothetical protein